MARTSRIAWILITSMMLTSLFAGMDWEQKSLEEFDEMQTTGRAAYELELVDVLQPRETYVDENGTKHNVPMVGDNVYFDVSIINSGENTHEEFNVRVTVTPAGDGQQPVIDNLDDAVCPGPPNVTGCSYSSLASSEFLGENPFTGNYRVQNYSGGDLVWIPSTTGKYIVQVTIDVDSSMDNDLTNNDFTYEIEVGEPPKPAFVMIGSAGDNGDTIYHNGFKQSGGLEWDIYAIELRNDSGFEETGFTVYFDGSNSTSSFGVDEVNHNGIQTYIWKVFLDTAWDNPGGAPQSGHTIITDAPYFSHQFMNLTVDPDTGFEGSLIRIELSVTDLDDNPNNYSDRHKMYFKVKYVQEDGSQEPPATGINSLSAILQKDAKITYYWSYGDSSMLTQQDYVNIYWCPGQGCNPYSGFSQTLPPSATSWQLSGMDSQTYSVIVQTENGNTDGNGILVTGGGMSMTSIADGRISPAPSIITDTPSVERPILTFSWNATDTGDVASWLVCWAESQSIVEDSFDTVVGEGACAETTDTTTSLTVTEQEMCGGSCSTNMFYAIGAKDSIGNVYSPDGTNHMWYVGYADGVSDPEINGTGVIDEDENTSIFDSDGDDIVDTEDDCPELSGTSTQPVIGCPDDDADGWANANDTFPMNRNEWNDADGDLVGDNGDQCPNTPLNTSVSRDGCELTEESKIVLYSVAGAGGLAGASILFFLLPRMMRGMNAEEQKERMKWDDQVWQETQGMPMGPPVQEAKQPGPEFTGVNRPDGYEYLEWPAASGDWWYRTGAGLNWSKWEQ